MLDYLEEIRVIINDMYVENRNSMCGSISLDDRLKEEIHFDSFDLAEFTVRIESKFGIDIYEDGIVYTIMDVVNRLRSGRNDNG